MKKWLCFWRLQTGSRERRLFLLATLWASFALAMAFTGLLVSGVVEMPMPFPLLTVSFVCGLPFWLPFQYFIIRDPLQSPDDEPLKVGGWIIFAIAWPLIWIIATCKWMRHADGSGGGNSDAEPRQRSRNIHLHRVQPPNDNSYKLVLEPT